MKNIFRQFVRIAAMLGLAGFAGANVQAANLVDTYPKWLSNWSPTLVPELQPSVIIEAPRASPSSSKDGRDVGQTFTTSQNQYLTSFSFWLYPHFDGDAAYTAKVYEWDDVAKQLVGNALYQSPSKALKGTDKHWQELSFNAGASLLKAGHSYVAFLHSEIYRNGNFDSTFTNYIAFLSRDVTLGNGYDDGYAMYRKFDNFNQSDAWDMTTWRRSDLAFRATVAPVPEPQTYVMLLAGLGLVGWRARSRRQR